MSRQSEFNVQCGLPKNWRPPEYLGPARTSPPITTPLGIQVRHQGFRRKDIIEFKRNVRARVILQEIDIIWREVREKYHATKLPDDWPRITIWPTLQWIETHGLYVGGLCTSNRDAYAVVWYRSVTGGRGVTNWEGYIKHELSHLCVGPWIEPETSTGVESYTQAEP